MAGCRTCGKNKGKKATPQAKETLQELYNSGNYEVARYTGGNYTHNIGSPTGAIVENNLTMYGRGQNGALLMVHIRDIEAEPFVFVKLEGDVLADAIKKLELTDKVLGTPEPMKEVVKTVEEIILSEPDENEGVTLEEALDEARDIAIEHTATDDVLLTRADAITTVEFAEQYGFTHHIAVTAKVRSGELKSYKHEDGRTLVYHIEEAVNGGM